MLFRTSSDTFHAIRVLPCPMTLTLRSCAQLKALGIVRGALDRASAATRQFQPREGGCLRLLIPLFVQRIPSIGSTPGSLAGARGA